MLVEQFIDPILGKTWKELGAKIRVSGKRVTVSLGYPAKRDFEGIREKLGEYLGVVDLELDLEFMTPSERSFDRVGHVIAVASGKGGVGKSTCAVSLALALEQEGAKVGLLDADIYGPSLGMMLGVSPGKRPTIKEEKYFEPIKAHGIKAMSMSFLVNEKTPMVWRGPMASGALQQMLLQTLWDELDYLIVDMPPGTGDIQLTLSQKVPVTGAVIVTTPQDLALQDAVKGIEMFTKVDIPVVGIIENMSVHVCENCGHESPLFGSDGGMLLAEKWEVPLLAQVPLAAEIREQTDLGVPVVDPVGNSASAEIFRRAARQVAARLWELKGSSPDISIVEN